MRFLITAVVLILFHHNALTAQAWTGEVSVSAAVTEMKNLLHANPGLSTRAKVVLFVAINELFNHRGAGMVDIVDRPDTWGVAETDEDAREPFGVSVYVSGWAKTQRVRINRGKLVRWIKNSMCSLGCFSNGDKDCILKYEMLSVLAHEVDHALYCGKIGGQTSPSRKKMECQAYRWQRDLMCSIQAEVTKFLKPHTDDKNKKCKLGYWWDWKKEAYKAKANETFGCGL